LKEGEGLFSISAAGITTENRSGGDRRRITVRFPLPSNAPAASYSLRFFGFRDGTIAALGEGKFELSPTEPVAFTTSLAKEQGLLYGFVAVIVALAAGLGVGFLYGSEK
jgi:hypothetical protein